MRLARLAVVVAACAGAACASPPERPGVAADQTPCLTYYAHWDRVVGPVALDGDRARDCYWQLPQ
jgi:hypothetical protein